MVVRGVGEGGLSEPKIIYDLFKAWRAGVTDGAILCVVCCPEKTEHVSRLILEPAQSASGGPDDRIVRRYRAGSWTVQVLRYEERGLVSVRYAGGSL